MQKLRLFLSPLLLVGTLFSISNWGAARAMALDGSSEFRIPAIVKNYKEPNNLERVLLTILRDENTKIDQFVKAAQDATPFLVHRVFECLDLQEKTIQTPVAQCIGTQLKDNVVLTTVLRSGDALLEGFRVYFPKAPVGKILVQRNEQTAEPYFLYRKLPKCFKKNKKIVILEPMIATGGSLCMVIGILLENGITQKNIIISSVVAAPEGLQSLANEFPEISVTVLSIDEKLNEKKYIVPGLGDFGDRFYGTVDYDVDSEDAAAE